MGEKFIYIVDKGLDNNSTVVIKKCLITKETLHTYQGVGINVPKSSPYLYMDENEAIRRAQHIVLGRIADTESTIRKLKENYASLEEEARVGVEW